MLELTRSLTSVSQIARPAADGLLIQYDLLSAWGLAAAAVALIGLAIASRLGVASLTRAGLLTIAAMLTRQQMLTVVLLSLV